MTDLERQERHEAWVRWVHSIKKEGPDPGPGFKDCWNCPVRGDYDPEDREQFCRNSCPYDDLPRYPHHSFMLAEIWADLPDVFLERHADRLGMKFCLEVSRLKRYREDKKMAQLAGLRLG